MLYTVTIEETPGGPIVEITGEIDINAFEALVAAGQIVAAAADQVVFEVSGVTFIDSVGLSAFLALSKDGLTPVLRGATDQVRRALEITQLDQVVTIED